MKTTNIVAAALVAITGVAAIATPVLADGSKLFDDEYYITQLRYETADRFCVPLTQHLRFR